MSIELSVVIPALNEEAHLPPLLADLKAQRAVGLEVIIADGGSTDSTLARCRPFSPRIIQVQPGRALQLNAGSKAASGSSLLFLHADSRMKDPDLLRKALDHWHGALNRAGQDTVAGHFSLEFLRTTGRNNTAFRYTAGKTGFNRANTTNGDQGFFIEALFFERLQGFDESQHFLEDQKLAEKIRIEGTWTTLPGKLYTSGRRFEAEGYHRRYILMSMLMALYSTGHMAFFKRAGAVYANQSDTGHLPLKPYFGAAVRMFVYDLGFWKSARAWFSIGRYIRQNSWQMFYFFDIVLRTPEKSGTYPLLKFHDRYFGPFTDNPVCDTVNTFFSFFWFMLVLAPYFFVVDTLREITRA